MESIVLFSFPTVNYRCTLNTRGRRRYGTLEELFHTNRGTRSTVGYPDGSIVERPDIRNSTKYTSVVEFDLDPDLINTHLQTLLPYDAKSIWTKTQKYDVLEYGVGGFFKEHQDKQLHKYHYGTLLVFPPAVGDFAHTGGELLLNKGTFTFDSSSNREWNCIAFKTELFHECKEVTSGKRVVFKTELYSTNHVEKDYGMPGIVDGGIHRMRLPTPPYHH
jgi:hypothetical protein